MSLQNSPTPYYPDLQNISAAFNASGVFNVNTKFRRVTGFWIQPLFTASTINTLGALYQIAASSNQGIIHAELINASTQISSTFGTSVWATGIM